MVPRSIHQALVKVRHNHILLRGSLAKLACRVGHRLCVTRAKQLYADWMADNHTNRIPPSLRPTVYCTAIQWGGQLEWQFLHNQLKTVNRDDELSNIRYALPCTRDAWLLNEYITSLLSRQPAEQSEITEAISHVAHNPMGQIILWDHIREEWQQMISEYITSLLSRQPAEQSEITEAISHVAHNPTGQIILWDFLRKFRSISFSRRTSDQFLAIR
ncbi:hypothetical protein T265_11538 [Opisthorchis viverrini]|uniref:ERAP1-like C-terminal domain-containing protein n=1 Tax=Opisthorchis viverrini TaxID=6198 RepID=A0A074YYN9_OPIVI|nr:hypothetical protein T265_11538 [Opisthorchis viverrini]KER19773.1 hypothetical protein T265_11538 [Opisthorchis viverrini]